MDRCIYIEHEKGKEAVTFDYAFLISSDDVDFGVGGGEREQTSFGTLHSTDDTTRLVLPTYARLADLRLL